jgi:hypothetical protein
MYKIIKAMSKDGTDKLPEMEKLHSLCGELYINNCVFFIYDDDSGKMMRTSTVENVTMVDKYIMVTTRNTEYCFEKVEE